MVKKISCVGYHATGSGAVDDFLREFDNIHTAEYGEECRFLQDPDAISDLEYNLIENPHRLNSGFALKKFLSYAKFEKRVYNKIFNGKWMEWAKSYVEELSEFSYKGYWHADKRLLCPIHLYLYKVRRGMNKMLPYKVRKNKYYNYFPNINTYFVDITEEDFLSITQRKCEELCKIMNKENKEYVVLDQVLSPQNISRYLRYIPNLKVIIVDRDPRDVYLSDVIKNNDFVLPKDVNKFCKVYKMSRKRYDCLEHIDTIMRINFEDMIYHYEKTTKKIMDFLGLDISHHIFVKKYFDPGISIKNTKQWELFPEYVEAISTIEDNLSEMLYCYN